ncbi:hypothetical protein [Halococcus sp. PRR34]|uniref:hypothetical protein n=1 Tax=Halococcus sp. PRR34 TaxID=3020830 RepID=UPI00236185DA|nr:hypothetical protein [Halococcus sp. PRR34]
MSDNYLVELKASVFRETPLTEDEFDDDLRIEFPSEDHAEAWVSERNRSHSKMGDITLHTAHPNDSSTVDAYVVFQPVQKVWTPDSNG